VSVEIRPVVDKRDRKRFLDLPYRLYATEKRWVPPLRIERKEHLDPGKNPFFEHAEVQLFLAERDGRVVGRISAHIDRNLNGFQDNRWGLFGFFECEDDAEAARALVETAEAWLRERGRDRMVGPMDFTTNDECGLLIEGHERPPIILCPWQHPYYQPLLEEACGLDKAMDLLMWELHIQGKENVNQAIWDVADAVEPSHGIVVRPMNKKDLQNEVTRFLEVYNASWERNWGFVPLNEAEARHYAKQLKPVLDPNWAYIAERKDTGEVVGAALTLPDFNQVLSHVKDGRLLPFGWLAALRNRKNIDSVRVLALGVKPEYQHTGVAARMYQMHFEAAERTPQTWGEMGWILETNKAMNRAMEGMGGHVVRKYRVYERELSGESG
jgi:GNAT superfamily N-acetyltransferase